MKIGDSMGGVDDSVDAVGQYAKGNL